MKKGDFKSAIPMYEGALNLVEKEFGKENEKYLTIRNDMNHSIIHVWEKDKIIAFLDENVQLCKKYNSTSLVYSHALQNLATFYLPINKGNNTVLCESNFKEALNVSKQFNNGLSKEYASSLHNLSILYIILGKYELSLPLNQKSLEIRKLILGEKHLDYIASLNNIAILHKSMGNYTLALPLYNNVLELRKEILGEKHPDYANSLNNLAIVYHEMGNYTTSVPLFIQALDVMKMSVGDKHILYNRILFNLSRLYTDMDSFSLAFPLLKESVLNIKQIMGEDSPQYANSLNSLATLYLLTNNYHQALLLYTKSLGIFEKNYGQVSPDYTNVVTNLATIHTDIGQYDKSLELYKQALKLNKDLYGSKHYRYYDVLKNWSVHNWVTDEKDLAVETQSQVKKWAVEQTEIQFPILTEQQKEFYFNEKLKKHLNIYHAFAIEIPNHDTKDFYDTQLATKGILVQTALKMKSRILNSRDSTLIDLYRIWTEQKKAIIKAGEMSLEVRNEKGINLDSLLKLNETIEQQLSKKSEAFKNLAEKEETKWFDIRNKLKKGEAAIEVVRINKFGVPRIVTDTSDVAKAPNFPKYPINDLTDTVQYAALIIRKNSKEPELVLLKNGNDLESQFSIYQKNAILYMQEDDLSYNEFWKPIAQKLKGIKKVYFSPDGVYNQISINTLQNPETKEYVLDEIELHLVTNTKDILAFGKSENKNLKAELLGYPIYDLQTQNANESRKRELEADTTRTFANFQKVSLLPGTKEEIKKINQILSNQKYKIGLLLDKSATEENIKKVRNPKILHLSTHGFFIDSKEKNANINPMLRSGLLLTGVSDYTRAEIKPDTEDGILTALEAANLDLDETDLVVLSACETGLGDVKAGEGVYGLQRAFKVAGAKTIVMSMWKVDDTVTQKLMTIFYQKFAKYNNARKAFNEAQAEIKTQHPEPYFWGAFVMTGE